MAKRKTKMSSLEDYLNSLPDKKEMYTFENHSQAHEFGHKLRENVRKEQNVDCWEDCEGISIEISERVVRIKILSPEPVCV